MRLYTNGVFHSQWNENRPFSGGIWDCLSLPVLYRDEMTQSRALVLGVGGGAALRQLALLRPAMSIVGVEYDAEHIVLARRYFGLDDIGAELVEGDARAMLAGWNGEPFDLLVDDLFGHVDGRPERAVPMSDAWVATLAHNIGDAGLLVVNTIARHELAEAAAVLADHGFGEAMRWSLPAYENAIGVFSREALDAREWTRRLDTLALPSACKRAARNTVRRRLRQ